MAYSNNIPLPTDKLSQSQADLLNNFVALKQLIDINHVTFGDPDEGKHYKIEMPVQGAQPVVGAGEIGLFNFLDPISNANQLYINKQDGTQFPLTASKDVITAGYTYLPSGLLMKWGLSSLTMAGQNVIAYPVMADIPVFGATPYSFQLTPVFNGVNNGFVMQDSSGAGGNVNSATQLVVWSSVAGGIQVFWNVIGIPA